MFWKNILFAWGNFIVQLLEHNENYVNYVDFFGVTTPKNSQVPLFEPRLYFKKVLYILLILLQKMEMS